MIARRPPHDLDRHAGLPRSLRGFVASLVLALAACRPATSGQPPPTIAASEASSSTEPRADGQLSSNPPRVALEPPPISPDRVSAPHLVVLGTAQDGGFPHASCHCERCEIARADPSKARMVASLAIVFPERNERYLIDATPDIRTQLERLSELAPRPVAAGVDRDPVDGIFLTHAHMGHYTGLAFFGFEAIHSQRVPVYCTPKMAAFLRSNAPWSQLVDLSNILLHPSAPGRAISLHEIRITPVQVPHRDEFADTVAYVIEGPHRRVVYVPDTEPWERWNDGVADLVDGADLLLVDGSFLSPDELPGRSLHEIGHPLMTRTMDRWQSAVDAGELELQFTHLNHSNAAIVAGSAAHAQIAARGFGVLHEGQRIKL